MAVQQQTRLEDGLLFDLPCSGDMFTIQLSDDICFGNSAVGGYITAVLHKAASLYAANSQAIQSQIDVWSSTTRYYRPVFPSKGPFKVQVYEDNLGKTWSALSVKMFQGLSDKVAAVTTCIMTDLSSTGISLRTTWKMAPSPSAVDLASLEQDISGGDQSWTCYHTPFYHAGFRRAHSYVKYFIRPDWSADTSCFEQWVLPGWDCRPLGSREPSIPEAHWTNEMLPFILDLALPVQESYFPRGAGEPLPVASMKSTLAFAATQKKAREVKMRTNWRELGEASNGDGSRPDGFKVFMARKNVISTTISMTLEIKKRLPPEGVRCLYLRAEVKSVLSNRLDCQILCFDENMTLIAIRNGIEQLLQPVSKNQRKGATL